MARKKKKVSQPDNDLDLTPMIDVIFLLIIFFILAGRITSEMKLDTITVAPTKTATKIEIPEHYGHVVVEILGKSRTGDNPQDTSPRSTLRVSPFISPLTKDKLPERTWLANSNGILDSYVQLRKHLDEVYAKSNQEMVGVADRQMPVAQTLVELRADANAEYRIVQEIQQLLADTVDFEVLKQNNDDQTTKLPTKKPENQKPFAKLIFTTLPPRDINK